MTDSTKFEQENQPLVAINALSQEQRIEASRNAERAVIASMGDQPAREQFHTTSHSTYGRVIDTGIIILILFVLIAAFILSAMRLYYIGEGEFMKSIQDEAQARVAGITIVMLAEASAVLFIIALSVIGRTLITRTILIALAMLTTAIALSGNYYVALHGREITLFSVLEAMSPPILTLGASFVLKEYLLTFIERRHRAMLDYEAARAAYSAKTANPKAHPDYPSRYANALKDKLIDINKRRVWNGQKVADVISSLSSQDWSLLVSREMASDNWFQQQAESVQEVASRAPGFLPMQSVASSPSASKE